MSRAVIEDLVDDDEFALAEIDSKCDDIKGNLDQMERINESRHFRVESMLTELGISVQEVQLMMEREDKSEEDREDKVKEQILAQLRDMASASVPQVFDVKRNEQGMITQVVVKS